jgi:hypothetical protein
MTATTKPARQLYRELKEGGASEQLINAIVDQRTSHPLDLAAKAIVGLFGLLPTLREGQLGVVLIFRSLLHDTLTMYGGSGTEDGDANEEDLAIARMLLRDAEAIERHISGTLDKSFSNGGG